MARNVLEMSLESTSLKIVSTAGIERRYLEMSLESLSGKTVSCESGEHKIHKMRVDDRWNSKWGS